SVYHHAAAGEYARLDAHPQRDDQPACTAVHRRDVRLLPAVSQKSADEGTDAASAETGPRLRYWADSGDTEPGGPRLQGAFECRDMVYRTIAIRERQTAHYRRAAVDGGCVRFHTARDRKSDCRHRAA